MLRCCASERISSQSSSTAYKPPSASQSAPLKTYGRTRGRRTSAGPLRMATAPKAKATSTDKRPHTPSSDSNAPLTSKAQRLNSNDLKLSRRRKGARRQRAPAPWTSATSLRQRRLGQAAARPPLPSSQSSGDG